MLTPILRLIMALMYSQRTGDKSLLQQYVGTLSSIPLAFTDDSLRAASSTKSVLPKCASRPLLTSCAVDAVFDQRQPHPGQPD
jgi:hypothetical protein